MACIEFCNWTCHRPHFVRMPPSYSRVRSRAARATAAGVEDVVWTAQRLRPERHRKSLLLLQPHRAAGPRRRWLRSCRGPLQLPARQSGKRLGVRVRGSLIHIRPSGKDSVLSITSTPGLENYPLCQRTIYNATKMAAFFHKTSPHAPDYRCPLVGWPSHVVIIIVYHQRCGCPIIVSYKDCLFSLSFSCSSCFLWRALLIACLRDVTKLSSAYVRAGSILYFLDYSWPASWHGSWIGGQSLAGC